MLLSDQNEIIQQAKFIYSPLVEVLEKQTKKLFDALKLLNISDKTDELKQIESIFPQNQFNASIIDLLNKTKQLQNNIKLNDLENTTKRRKHYSFSKYSCYWFFKSYPQGKFVIKRCWLRTK